MCNLKYVIPVVNFSLNFQYVINSKGCGKWNLNDCASVLSLLSENEKKLLLKGTQLGNEGDMLI